MKRLFPRIERPALLGLAIALATFGAACSPNQSVKPGAPVLTEIDIVENPYSPTSQAVTSIPSNVTDCPGAAASDGGGATDGAIGGTAAAATGGMCDPAVPICRQASAKNWCRCVANTSPSPPAPTCTDAGTPDAGTPDAGTPDAGTVADAGSADAASDAAAPLGGTWNCDPFAPTSVALFVFDRLLDTAPLDPGDAGGLTNIATTTLVPTPPQPVTVTGDYASNGSPNEVIFPPPVLEDFRANGPSLLFAGDPTLPAGTALSITLDPNKVRAKDGRTAFTGTGFFAAGSLIYSTAAFKASIATPPTTPLPADAGTCAVPPITVTPDKTPVTITFNNLVDPTASGTHVTITATTVAGPIAFKPTSANGLTVSLTPTDNWPASATISITLDATATDLDGDALGSVGPVSFTTSAN